MCKKSLRTAIDLHKRLVLGNTQDGSYQKLSSDERKDVFNKKLLELEPVLKPCPFCGELPIYDRGCLSPYGVSAGGGGWSSNISCENCDYVFKGAFSSVSVIEQWNNRA